MDVVHDSNFPFPVMRSSCLPRQKLMKSSISGMCHGARCGYTETRQIEHQREAVGLDHLENGVPAEMKFSFVNTTTGFVGSPVLPSNTRSGTT